MRKYLRAIARSNMHRLGIPRVNKNFSYAWRNFVSLESGKRYLRKLAKELAAKERARRIKLMEEEKAKQAALKEAGNRFRRPSLFARIVAKIKVLFMNPFRKPA